MTFSALASAILSLLSILLIKEGEVVRILAFSLTRIGIVRLIVLSVSRYWGVLLCVIIVIIIIIIYFQELLLLLAMCWRALLVTY